MNNLAQFNDGHFKVDSKGCPEVYLKRAWAPDQPHPWNFSVSLDSFLFPSLVL